MRLPATIAAIAAIFAAGMAVGGWTLLTGTSSSAAITAKTAFERPNSPSQPTLQPLW